MKKKIASDKEKNLELKNVTMPDWMPVWASNNPGEAVLMFLIFAPETSVSKYYNKKYPSVADDYNQVHSKFESHDFKKEGWETYIEMKHKDESQG